MRSRLAPMLLLALITPSFLGCYAARRAGKDLAVVATSPVTIPLNGVYEALEESPDTGQAAPFEWGAVNVPFKLVEHSFYTVAYGVDLLLSPFYLAASVNPWNDLPELDYYTLCKGYPWKPGIDPFDVP